MWKTFILQKNFLDNFTNGVDKELIYFALEFSKNSILNMNDLIIMINIKRYSKARAHSYIIVSRKKDTKKNTDDFRLDHSIGVLMHRSVIIRWNGSVIIRG